MDRAQEIELAGVRDRLPASIGAVDLDPTTPGVGPDLAVLAAKAIESPLCPEGGHPARLLVRAGVGQIGHERREKAEGVTAAGARPQVVGGREPAPLIARFRLSLRVRVALERGGVGDAERRDVAPRVPAQATVDAFIRPLV